MHVLVFEDERVEQLGVLATARPACDLTLGATTLHDALAAFGTVERVLRPHLARYLSSLAGRRTALWGGACDSPPELPESTHGAVALVVNARVIPSRDNLARLRSLADAGRRAVVSHSGGVSAAVLHRTPAGDGIDDAILREMRTAGRGSAQVLDAHSLPQADLSLDLLTEPHHAVEAHEQALAGALAIKLDSGRFREVRRGLFVADGASVADEVVVRHGPVVVGAGAEIGPFVCLDGPLWIGPRTRVNPHAWLRAGTAIGADCRVGGEIEATVMEAFSNKAHDGFLGHSHVGSWVNLAAGTVTSNLKATYGPVRLHEHRSDGSRATTDTGRQFFGALIGDLVKTAINASIPCGARIGLAATVQGTVPDVVPAFTNEILGGRSSADQVATVLERTMARRGLELLAADRELLAILAG